MARTMVVRGLAAQGTLAALSVTLVLSGACVKKGDGKGTRAERPNFKDSGSIFDDGLDNIDPKPPEGLPDNDERTPEMDPEAVAILAACFKIDPSEVAYIVGWTNPTQSRVAAQALCDQLANVNYGDGVSLTAAEVAVE